MLSAKVRIAARLAAVFALAGLTAGCFQPMYAEHKDGSPDLRDKLSTVDLPPVDKPNASREARVGVQIRNALAFKMYGNATGTAPLYHLVLRFSSSRSSPTCWWRSRSDCIARRCRSFRSTAAPWSDRSSTMSGWS